MLLWKIYFSKVRFQSIPSIAHSKLRNKSEAKLVQHSRGCRVSMSCPLVTVNLNFHLENKSYKSMGNTLRLKINLHRDVCTQRHVVLWMDTEKTPASKDFWNVFLFCLQGPRGAIGAPGLPGSTVSDILYFVFALLLDVISCLLSWPHLV